MSFEIVLVLAIVAGAVACFATERLPVDLVALLVLSILLVSGILTPEQAISGFGNTATATVAAMFVLSAGLVRTGAVSLLGKRLTRVGRLGLRPSLVPMGGPGSPPSRIWYPGQSGMSVRTLPLAHRATGKASRSSSQRLVVVANRLPVAAARGEDDTWSLLPGSGGLVTALDPVLEARGGLWVGWPGLVGENDAKVRPLLESFAARHGYGLVPVSLTRSEHELFYLGFANEVLWPLFHDLQSRCTFVPEYWQAFLDVNRKFAVASGAALRPGDMLWVHDYLLLCVGRFVRELAPEARLGFFLHIPFPPPDVFAKLPWRTEVLQALLAYDLVGFQTVRDRRNFIAGVRALLPEAVVRGRGNAQRVIFQGRRTRSATFPIGIDSRGFADLARRPDVAARAQSLREAMGVEHLLLGVDRLDYTKGIPFKLEAVRRLLRARPDLHRRLALVQILVPSRSDIPEYLHQKAEVERLVGEINGELGQPGWNPVHYFFRSVNREELVAYYRAASVCLATPLKDGMNLVAKEYCACQIERRGVLVLSEFAGAAVQLGEGALLVNPYDILGVAAAIARACEMPAEERRRRMARLQRNVLTEDVHRWVEDFLSHVSS